MPKIDIFYQREGAREVNHLEVTPNLKLAELKTQLIEKGHAEVDTLIFLEDTDEPAKLEAEVGEIAGKSGLKVHLHRCKKVEVSVAYAGRVESRKFPPAATLAAVHRWATHEFRLSPDDASEHKLQLKGTHDRPSVGTHIGTLATCPKCRVEFDLVPDERVQG